MLRKLLQFLLRLFRTFRGWLKQRSRFSKYFSDLMNISDFEAQFYHELMLADSERVDSYYAAIAAIINPGDAVLDLGAGTGILSCFAALRAKQVYAVEHSSIIEVAKKICVANDIENVQFFQVNCRDFHPPTKFDVIVHEQIGGGNPFSENMVENLLDARRRLLKPGGKILPNQFEIFLEPVELNQSNRIPFLWEFNLHSIRFHSLRPEREKLPATGKSIDPSHVRSIFPAAIKRSLCSPHPILSFDLESLQPDDLAKHIHYENVAICAGRVDGLCMYFKALNHGREFLGNEPNGIRTHWPMILYRFEETLVDAGSMIAYDLDIGSLVHHNTWSINWLRPERK